MYLQALKGEGGESGGTKGRKTLLPPGSEFKAFLPSIPFNSRKMGRLKPGSAIANKHFILH